MDELDVLQTRASFDYQWSRLPQNRWSLASAEYRKELPDLVAGLLDVPPAWFEGREALDAGCGCGRHAFALCSLGARVLAVDRSLPALRATREACAPFAGFRGALAADLLHPLPAAAMFDLVWSFGVLHHTGDLPRALHNLGERLRPGGILFLMLYGIPRPGHASDAAEIASLEAWRARLAPLPFAAKVEALHAVAPAGEIIGYFDAVSPRVNERYALPEIEAWLAREGFVEVRRRLDRTDHFLVARRS
ncbi:MAG TPA: methyltransferase domain-containing protein [Thermoanaerobaculia bacterium]|nr:methyltransferase domain-containing protein [Thermoanaerobaculia bacterium]